MKSIERNCWKNYHSIENNQLIDSILYFCGSLSFREQIVFIRCLYSAYNRIKSEGVEKRSLFAFYVENF